MRVLERKFECGCDHGGLTWSRVRALQGPEAEIEVLVADTPGEYGQERGLGRNKVFQEIKLLCN